MTDKQATGTGAGNWVTILDLPHMLAARTGQPAMTCLAAVRPMIEARLIPWRAVRLPDAKPVNGTYIRITPYGRRRGDEPPEAVRAAIEESWPAVLALGQLDGWGVEVDLMAAWALLPAAITPSKSRA